MQNQVLCTDDLIINLQMCHMMDWIPVVQISTFNIYEFHKIQKSLNDNRQPCSLAEQQQTLSNK